MKKIKELKTSKYVVGCRIGDTIYINPGLVEAKYQQLFIRILEHERKHSSGLDKHDMWMDIVNDDLKGVKKLYWGFVLTHPKTWIGFLPFTRIDKKWNMDLGLSLIWLLAIGGAALLTWTL
jgi:hypothetical protein